MQRATLASAAVLSIAAFPIDAADIVLTPPAAGGVAITNAAGTATRMRVGDDGVITMPGLGVVPGSPAGLCVEIASGTVGTCTLATGTVNGVTASAPLTSSGGATPNIAFADVPVGQVLAGTGGAPAFTGSPLLSGNLGFGFASTATSGSIMKGLSPFLHNVGITNTFAGLDAGNFTMGGGNNTGVGIGALTSNTSGNNNTAQGASALTANTTGGGNTAIGVAAMGSSSAGSNNTAVGYQALFAKTTGTGNIAIGHQAGFSLTTGDNNISIGHPGGSAGEANAIRIGVGQARAHIAGIFNVTTDSAAVPVLVDSSGQLGTAISSLRAKEQVADMGTASDSLLRMRPVTFVYKQQQAAGNPLPQYGLIAEEVADVAPELVVRGADGQPQAVKYHLLAPMLLNELQKQRRIIDEQAARIEALERTLARNR